MVAAKKIIRSKQKISCSLEHCERDATSKGLCTKHYTRLKRNGHTGLSKVVRKDNTYKNMQQLLRKENRYKLTLDEKETLDKLFTEGLGVNECENVFKFE